MTDENETIQATPHNHRTFVQMVDILAYSSVGLAECDTITTMNELADEMNSRGFRNAKGERWKPKALHMIAKRVRDKESPEVLQSLLPDWDEVLGQVTVLNSYRNRHIGSEE